MKHIKYILYIFLFFIFACGEEKQSLKVSPFIKVLLISSNSAVVETENYVLTYYRGREIGNGKIFIKLSNKVVYLNDIEVLNPFNIEISPEKFFSLNGKRYRGNLLVIFTNNLLHFVNIIDIENYLYSVVPSEVYTSWEKEAIKAQAVVARTFALYELSFSRGKQRFFDVYADTRSQVYNGINVENENITAFVRETTGEILRYGGKIIPAFFHSASGGMTESSKEFLGYEKPYLIPIESKYSSAYPENKWEHSIDVNNFNKLFGIKENISMIKVTKRTDSKRIKEIAIIDSLNKTNLISGKELRSRVGEQNLKSLRANIFLTNNKILFQGFSFGHGVGFGQWDAQGMAKDGMDYKTILRFFFPGVTIDKIW